MVKMCIILPIFFVRDFFDVFHKFQQEQSRVDKVNPYETQRCSHEGLHKLNGDGAADNAISLSSGLRQ